MNSNDAREQRRKAIGGIQTALRTISADGSYLRSIESCEAVAMAWQCVGALQAIDEQEAYTEACEAGRPARFPRPVVETIDPDVFMGLEIDPLLTPQQIEAAYHQAFETFEQSMRSKPCGG